MKMNMKKTYLTPRIKVLGEISEELMAGSVTGDAGDGIGYGGVDTGGDKDPEAKESLPDGYTDYFSVWDE